MEFKPGGHISYRGKEKLLVPYGYHLGEDLKFFLLRVLDWRIVKEFAVDWNFGFMEFRLLGIIRTVGIL